MKKSLHYILFDLDGTLTDPAEGITNSILYALRELKACPTGKEPSKESLYRFIGPPLAESFLEFFPPEGVQQAIDTYRVYFRQWGMFENTVYPGIPEMLRTLAEKNIPLAVATSKPEDFAVIILRHFGLADSFTESGGFIGGADMAGTRGEKAQVIARTLSEMGCDDPSRCIMVGDRKFDIQGGHSFGMTTVGVLWGYGNREELTEAGADYIVSDTKELTALLTGLTSQGEHQ